MSNKKEPKLLSRKDFRESIFKRDDFKCIFCEQKAKDAHHIMERRLFVDGGYYLDNGASVCEEHHLKCEMTLISPQEVREAANITNIVLPEHLYHDQVYDKWGNVVLSNGQRLPGDLFYDESVQKILKKGNVLDCFTHWVKYPRTFHLPWSDGMNSDDKMMSSVSPFEGQRVIVTEKMDGENTTMYNDHIHARSLESQSHPSQSWVKQFWSSIKYEIPENWRICGENLYALHSVKYNDLSSYFLGFSIWNEQNVALSWDETLEWFQLLGINLVPVLYDGIYDEKLIKSFYDEKKDWNHREGYVVRLAKEIPYKNFKQSIGKFVRKGHIQTRVHNWKANVNFEVNKVQKNHLPSKNKM